jgi:hypothetical protein
VQLAVNNVNGKLFQSTRPWAKYGSEPPLILDGLLQERCRIKALCTVNREKEVRSNFIHMGKYCGGAAKTDQNFHTSQEVHKRGEI